MNQFASDLGSESTDMLLIPDDFEQQVAECQHFLKSLRTQPEFHSLEDPLPSSQWKELAMFEITYVELKVWLDRTRSLIQNRRNTSLSRCESYLTQDCLTELTMRETDLNRLRTLSANLNRPRGCQTLGDLKLTGSRSSTRVAAEMEEVELLWELTTAELAKQSYQCNYERTIRGLLMA
ncbi:hypothetical protein D915_006112 [Fasciola hepatica]|uniref:Uncharacterized protein n=1 Tax=Fasciola hepatica TaxID=6192 RepID=A0A4E0RZU7_FASHE|nr:hypothetical protein D915_006112 [Fasciola hepatica]